MNFSDFTEDVPELKNPSWVKEQAYAVLSRMNDPDVKELQIKYGPKQSLPYIHFKLDGEFTMFAEECTALFNKIVKGEFSDARNRDVLELILDQMEKMNNGEITQFQGEKQIGEELIKKFPVKKKMKK
jgi:hypothetical protein